MESASTFFKSYTDRLSRVLASIDVSSFERIIEQLQAARERGSIIYLAGNGGSAAVASHFANDLANLTRWNGQKPFKTICLSDNIPAITAIANDRCYEKVFSAQLTGIISKGDILIALSASGNSPNILEAVNVVKTAGAIVIGCTGFDGGKLLKLSDISFHIPTERGEYGIVEDAFSALDHSLIGYLTRALT